MIEVKSGEIRKTNSIAGVLPHEANIAYSTMQIKSKLPRSEWFALSDLHNGVFNTTFKKSPESFFMQFLLSSRKIHVFRCVGSSVRNALFFHAKNWLLRFQMRTRISIRGFVRPSVRRSVCRSVWNAFVKSAGKSHIDTKSNEMILSSHHVHAESKIPTKSCK